MVNIAKRMRALKPLLTVRSGRGAAILPLAPAPQLVHVHLISPAVKANNQPLRGARIFWRYYLRRLKYHNPALPITVDYANIDPKSPVTLTLKFEHQDPETLERIGGSIAGRLKKPVRQVVLDGMSEKEKEMLARQQSPNFREAPVSWKKAEDQSAAEDSAELPIEGEATRSESSEEARSDEDPQETDLSTLPGDEVVPSRLTPAVKGGPTLYMRTVTLGLRDRNSEEIWQWFADRTRCTNVWQSEEDREERSQLKIFFAQSEIDRQRVKEGRDAVKKEKADLLRARGEANRLSEEAV